MFLLAVNKMFQDCWQTTNNLFCDDGLLWASARTLAEASTKIQISLNKIQDWSHKTGFKFSVTKTCYCIFSRIKAPDIQLSLYNQPIRREDRPKYLGITFDYNLSWKTRIEILKNRGKKRLNILRCVARKKMGCRPQIANYPLFSTNSITTKLCILLILLSGGFSLILS